jgi:2-isopropylmalate synthase
MTPTDRNTIRIFDTTLRDGEQSPGASLNHNEKLEIARALDQLGVDIIEAGFPITSQGDFDAVRAIAQEVPRPVTCALARTVEKDVARAGGALEGAPNTRIHVFCATSKIHREHKLKKAFDEIIRISVEQVTHARSFTDNVEFSPEDASRTELDHLVEITQAVIEAGATTINIPDTVGYATPAEYGRIFSYVREKLPIIDEQGIVLSSHCHDDLGLAVANSLAAVQNGARQIECTINGIGERAGNASLEEVVMAMKTRADFYQLHTKVNTTRIYPMSRMVSQLTGLDVQRNKAIVGRNAFAHESGIHQDGVIKHRQTYEIMDPQDVGIPSNELVLGKHSGRHALRERITTLGYTINEEQLDRVYSDFKALADKKKSVYDEDIEALIESELKALPGGDQWKVASMTFHGGVGKWASATVALVDAAGASTTETSVGDGPVDAIYAAIQQITGMQVTLKAYAIRAVSQGRDAQGEVNVEVEYDGATVSGRGVSTDVVEASALAYLNAINRLTNLRERQADVVHARQP